MADDSNQMAEVEPQPMPIEKDLSEKGRAALLYIAKHTGVAQHDLKERLDANYQLLHYHFDRLMEKNLIREAGKKEVERGPDRKTYETTIAGLLYAYSKEAKNPRILEKLERRAPLVMGKRKHFEEHDVDHIILHSFRDFSEVRWGFCAYRLSQGRPEDEVVEELTKHFYVEILTFGTRRTFMWRRATGSRDEEIKRIGDALTDDEELRESTYPILEGLSKLFKAYDEIRKSMEQAG